MIDSQTNSLCVASVTFLIDKKLIDPMMNLLRLNGYGTSALTMVNEDLKHGLVSVLVLTVQDCVAIEALYLQLIEAVRVSGINTETRTDNVPSQ